ncbi:MAG: radical SAM/SPASM domain-containing protein [Candidatus Gottesmanbacteria bacterium]|nr:radical SAM/SPASM domain-containing protein [Candidatus Gottesmanbacteria bacterium]
MDSRAADEQKYFASLPVSQYPLQVNLEFSNFCNLQCAFCINKEPFFRTKGFASGTLIDTLISQLPKTTIVVICGTGEPMAHPKFSHYISLLSKHFTQLYLITNGHFLSERTINQILHSNICKLTVSLDYFNPAKYKQEKNGDGTRAIHNVELLLHMRKQVKKNKLQTIQINMLAQHNNEQDIIDAINYFSPLLGPNDYIYSRNIKTLGGLVHVKKRGHSYTWTMLDQFKEQIKNDVDISHYRTENWIKYLGLKQSLSKRLVCRHPFIYCVVLYDGRVAACCVDFNGSLIMGDLTKQTMKEIWNGPTYQSFRTDMRAINLKKYPICVHCEEWYKYKI